RANNTGVTLLTLRSVHWADRMVATRSSRGVVKSSSQCASGYIRANSRLICRERLIKARRVSPVGVSRSAADASPLAPGEEEAVYTLRDTVPAYVSFLLRARSARDSATASGCVIRGFLPALQRSPQPRPRETTRIEVLTSAVTSCSYPRWGPPGNTPVSQLVRCASHC